jgi:CRP-like cAMP-binding protein
MAKPGPQARMRYVRPVGASRARPVDGADLESLGSTVVMPRGRTVVEEGTPTNYVFKVSSGMLRTVHLLSDGRRSVINFLLPGDYFGFADESRHAHSIEVLADASLVRYPKRRLKDLIEHDPRTGQRFFSLICRQLSQAEDRMLMLSRKTALERIASFLLAMTDRGEDVEPDPNAATLPMSRADIADYLGLTVETVSRLLTLLRCKGVIELPCVNRFVVLDRRQLVELSESEIQ